MTDRQISLRKLRLEVARERLKAKSRQRRDDLNTELRQLREGKGIKTVRRLGRGFAVIAKGGARAAGKGIAAASKFAEEKGDGGVFEGINFSGEQKVAPQKRRAVAKTITQRVVKRRVKRKSVKRKPVKRKPVKRKSVKRRTVAKAVTRRIVRRQPPQESGGFFGGLPGVGF